MIEKLTKIQKDILNRLKNGVKCHFMPYSGRFGNAYYFMVDNHQSCTAQISALERKGYIKIKVDGYNNREITVKDLDALEEIGGK